MIGRYYPHECFMSPVIEGADIVYRDYIDISVAVATPKGLVVPVIRGVNEYKLVDFERELAKLAEKVRCIAHWWTLMSC
jgi:2-oxoglutarate dehydrogenase E2 component (dihydrolipoamide succinyltransferase)